MCDSLLELALMVKNIAANNICNLKIGRIKQMYIVNSIVVKSEKCTKIHDSNHISQSHCKEMAMMSIDSSPEIHI
jgi:hypothetical protein